MLTFTEWKEQKYGLEHQATFDEKGVCDGTCDSCLRGEYTDYIRENRWRLTGKGE